MPLKLKHSTQILGKKPGKLNIIVGSDPIQVRMIERYLNVEAVQVEQITDELLSGLKSCLFWVYKSHKIDLSIEFEGKVEVWSTEDPLTKNSSNAKTLVKFATSLYPRDPQYTKDELLFIESAVTKIAPEDIFSFIWSSVFVMTGSMEQYKNWQQPWESFIDWMDMSHAEYRLNTLYKFLVGYIQTHFITPELVKKGSRSAEFKNMSKLPKEKLMATIELLSKWKQGMFTPEVCAIQISAIWS